MIKRSRVLAWLAFLIFLSSCERATVEKTTKPVIAPIKKTTETIFKERTIGSKDKAQAVLFPRAQEEEQKHFKLTF